MAASARLLLGEVGVGLRRNMLMTVATVITITVSLALLGSGLLMTMQVQETRERLFAEVEVSIFLHDDITPSQRQALEDDLRDNPVVDEVIYESKEEAYENFQEIFADDPALVDSVTPELLPASYRVGLVDPQEFAAVESQFAGYPGVEEVADQREFLERFFAVMDALRNGVIGVALLVLVAAAALIVNTIRVAAFARREQIAIMRLVGAANWYIRLPFLLEGMVAGAAGGLAAGLLLVLGERTLVRQLAGEVAFLPFIGLAEVLIVVPILVAAGVIIAALASLVSLRRFLTV